MGKMSSELFSQLCGWKDRKTEVAVKQQRGCWGTHVRDILWRKEVQAGTGSVKPEGSCPLSEDHSLGWYCRIPGWPVFHWNRFSFTS